MGYGASLHDPRSRWRVTQSEPGVQPDRMADDIGWQAVTLKGELAHRASLISTSLSGQPSLCDNAEIAMQTAGSGPASPSTAIFATLPATTSGHPGNVGYYLLGTCSRRCECEICAYFWR